MHYRSVLQLVQGVLRCTHAEEYCVLVIVVMETGGAFRKNKEKQSA